MNADDNESMKFDNHSKANILQTQFAIESIQITNRDRPKKAKGLNLTNLFFDASL